MNKIEIKNRFNGSVIFSHDCENNTIKLTIEEAVEAKVSLSMADLSYADLIGADLIGANLRGANLSGANLIRANLIRADLSGADLSGANLSGANLSDANLSRADLIGADLSEANKVPMYCKWSYGITEDKIHIGCEKRTITEWDAFFASNKVLKTERNTHEFKQIQAVYEGLKAYSQFLNK